VTEIFEDVTKVMCAKGFHKDRIYYSNLQRHFKRRFKHTHDVVTGKTPLDPKRKGLYLKKAMYSRLMELYDYSNEAVKTEDEEEESLKGDA
jgi:hypothetical protein